jgi:hypothetical protein
MRRPARLAATAILAVAASSCTTQVAGRPVEPSQHFARVFDQTAVENGVRKILVGYGTPDGDITSVSCPPNQEVKSGNKFDCVVVLGGARDATVTVTAMDDNGTYQVGQPE